MWVRLMVGFWSSRGLSDWAKHKKPGTQNMRARTGQRVMARISLAGDKRNPSFYLLTVARELRAGGLPGGLAPSHESKLAKIGGERPLLVERDQLRAAVELDILHVGERRMGDDGVEHRAADAPLAVFAV